MPKIFLISEKEKIMHFIYVIFFEQRNSILKI